MDQITTQTNQAETQPATAPDAASTQMHTIWTEKYRPKTFDEIKGQKEIVSKIKLLAEKKNLPHLLLAGPPGVGKTTLSLVIARFLFGDQWKSNFLELNASDERGIDVVRHKVKDFARTKSIGNVPFKIIYLDECDALTKEAQQALRRTMENYTQTTRFILSCNYSSKIIEPVQSRCAVFRFKPLKKDEIYEVMQRISAQEGLTMDEASKDALFEVSGGDVRRVANILQSCAAINPTVTENDIYSIASYAKPTQLKDVLATAFSGNFKDARKTLLSIMLDYGLSGTDIVKQIQKELLRMEIDDRKRMELIAECGEAEFRISEGSDDFIQLEALLAKVGLAGMK